MDYVCIAVVASVSLALACTMLIITVLRKRRQKKVMNNEGSALKGIVAGIREQLHAAYPGSKWRWVCCPDDLTVNGGIARIDVLESSGSRIFIDVCFEPKNYAMTLQVANVLELTVSEADTDFPAEVSADDVPDVAVIPVTVTTPITEAKPDDETSVITWFNVVLIGALTNLIGDLHAEGEACLHISQDGRAYVEENDNIVVVHEFGELPDVALWSHIIDKLSGLGLFAEMQKENCLFISWA